MLNLNEIFTREGIILNGHFLLRSGFHSDTYFEKMMLINKPDIISELVSEIVKNIDADFERIAGPVLGGAILAFELGRQVHKPITIIEKTDNGYEIKRGNPIKKGEKIYLIDDVLTTGFSILRAIKAIESKGGQVMGIHVIVDRSLKDVGFKYRSLFRMEANIYAPLECPLCKKNEPLTEIGGKRVDG